MRCLLFLLLTLVASATWADSYTSPSGYLEIIGYRLEHTEHDGKPAITVTGSAMALADCPGAVMEFDVLDRGGNHVGIYKITHGEFFRHDGWMLGPGKFTSDNGDAQQAVTAADHLAVRQVECSRRQ